MRLGRHIISVSRKTELKRVAHNVEIGFVERKRVYRAETPLPSKNVPFKDENAFTEQKRGSLSEGIAIKAISDLKRGSQRRKSV